MARECMFEIPKDRAEILRQAWTEAAKLYSQELVPRFEPWLQSALRELKQHSLPTGPILVPCCGPGHELVLLHRFYGGQRPVYGLDLSQGMVDMAQEAIQAYLASNPAEAEAVSSAPLDAFVADASCIDEYGGAAALLSVFGLQQMGPVAPQALASWVRNVAPGGLAVVVLWPSKADPNGPWGAFDQVVLERAAAVAGKPPPPPNAAATAPAANWEMDLTGPALRDVAGAELLVDRLEQHSMVWESAMQLWKVMTEGGPWRARRLAQGEKVMNDLEARFLAKMAAKEEEQQLHLNGGYEQRPHLLEHHPFARVIVIRRKDVSCGTELAAMQQPQPAEVPLTEQLIGEGGRATASPKTCVRPHPQSTL